MKKLIVVASLLIAAPAFASTGDTTTNANAPTAERGETAGTSESSETEASDAGNRRVCRNVDYGAGSRVSSRRVCMTADQWRAQRRR